MRSIETTNLLSLQDLAYSSFDLLRLLSTRMPLFLLPFLFLVPTVTTGYAAPSSAGSRTDPQDIPKIAVLTPVAPWSRDCAGSNAQTLEQSLKLCSFLTSITSMAHMAVFTSFGPTGYHGGNKRGLGYFRKHGARPDCIAEASGRGQESEECEKHFAELLGNEYFLAGKLNFTEKIWSISYELQDIRTGKIISTSETFKTRSRTILLKAIEPLVVKLVRTGLGLPMPIITRFITVKGVKKKVTERKSVPELPVDDGLLRIGFKTPVASALYLDGTLQCLRTPCFLRVAPGMHHAKFEADRYRPADVEFEAEDEIEVVAELMPRFGWIAVETQRDALAMVDGKFASRGKWQEVEAEKPVTVAVTDSCYLPVSEQVTVKGGERRTLKLELKERLAGLKVNAFNAKGNKVDSYVTSNHGIVGRTGQILHVPLCSKFLTVEIDDYISGTKLQLKEGEVTVVTAQAPTIKKGEMVMLPAGSYIMAGTKREVTVAPFLLDIAEVTARAYRDCVKAGKCSEPQHQRKPSKSSTFMRELLLGGAWPAFSSPGYSPLYCTYDAPGMDNHPVNCLNWHQASEYCSWAGKRLPTEEEWEWAARGANRATEYPWGNEAPTYDHICKDGEGDTHELRMSRAFASTCTIGSYPKGDSPQGVKDLGGNVAEWTSSKQGAESAGRENSELRIYRGGFWGILGETMEYSNGRWEPVQTAEKTNFTGSVTGRGSDLPNRARNSIGFRCAKTP